MPAPRSLGGTVLTLNAGSSSLKFAIFGGEDGQARILSGKFDRIGLAGSEFFFTEPASGQNVKREVPLPDHAACLPLLDELLTRLGVGDFSAVGHRVVHGGPNYFQQTRITTELLADLRGIESFAPNHLPASIALMEAVAKHRPAVPQVACFDTEFHRELPVAARLLPIPRRFAAQGVRRYGFHGLAFASVLDELRRQMPGPLPGRVLLAHLGNGASMAAVRDGRCIDTTMGFTPAAGLVMSTRSGDLDPGLVAFLAKKDGIGPEEFERLVTEQSGLLGLSETSSDVRDLLAREATDQRAVEALAVFCHQARKFIGALTATLGGLDVLVFSGGIGENSAVIRERICTGLEFLGIALDAQRNRANAPVISPESGRVSVRIIPADEERHLAEAVRKLLSAQPKNLASTADSLAACR